MNTVFSIAGAEELLPETLADLCVVQVQYEVPNFLATTEQRVSAGARTSWRVIETQGLPVLQEARLKVARRKQPKLCRSRFDHEWTAGNRSDVDARTRLFAIDTWARTVTAN
jgi:hypothetical protein